MGSMKHQYQSVVKFAIGIAASLQLMTYLVFREVNPALWVAPEWRFVFDVCKLSFAPLVGWLIIVIYESFGWKLFFPHLDFSGRWELTDRFYLLNSEEQKPYMELTGHIEVEQSVLSLSIRGVNFIQGTTEIRSAWTSTSVSVGTHDLAHSSIVMSIEHIRHLTGSLQREARRAVEVITVTRYASGRFRKGRPIEMLSKVYHCVDQ